MICLWVGCITQVYIETTNILVMDSDSKDYLFEESHGSFHSAFRLPADAGRKQCSFLSRNYLNCSP